MRAILAIALNAESLPADQRDLSRLEKQTIVGTGQTWTAARADALTQVPPGAIRLHWFREE